MDDSLSDLPIMDDVMTDDETQLLTPIDVMNVDNNPKASDPKPKTQPPVITLGTRGKGVSITMQRIVLGPTVAPQPDVVLRMNQTTTLSTRSRGMTFDFTHAKKKLRDIQNEMRARLRNTQEINLAKPRHTQINPINMMLQNTGNQPSQRQQQQTPIDMIFETDEMMFDDEQLGLLSMTSIQNLRELEPNAVIFQYVNLISIQALSLDIAKALNPDFGDIVQLLGRIQVGGREFKQTTMTLLKKSKVLAMTKPNNKQILQSITTTFDLVGTMLIRYNPKTMASYSVAMDSPHMYTEHVKDVITEAGMIRSHTADIDLANITQDNKRRVRGILTRMSHITKLAVSPSGETQPYDLKAELIRLTNLKITNEHIEMLDNMILASYLMATFEHMADLGDNGPIPTIGGIPYALGEKNVDLLDLNASHKVFLRTSDTIAYGFNTVLQLWISMITESLNSVIISRGDVQGSTANLPKVKNAIFDAMQHYTRFKFDTLIGN